MANFDYFQFGFWMGSKKGTKNVWFLVQYSDDIMKLDHSQTHQIPDKSDIRIPTVLLEFLKDCIFCKAYEAELGSS